MKLGLGKLLVLVWDVTDDEATLPNLSSIW